MIYLEAINDKNWLKKSSLSIKDFKLVALFPCLWRHQAQVLLQNILNSLSRDRWYLFCASCHRKRSLIYLIICKAIMTLIPNLIESSLIEKITRRSPYQHWCRMLIHQTFKIFKIISSSIRVCLRKTEMFNIRTTYWCGEFLMFVSINFILNGYKVFWMRDRFFFFINYLIANNKHITSPLP